MSITVNTNQSALVANLHLSRNNNNLRKSIARLSSGKRIEKPTDDAGGMAVAMKLESAVLRSGAAMQNILNATSLLEVQDGVLSNAGALVDRMSELKSLYHDVMKNDSDRESYNKEFRDLQVQLYDMTRIKFNGVSLFAEYTTKDGSTQALFEGSSTEVNAVPVYMNPDGDDGIVASIHKALLLSALTINASNLTSSVYANGNQSTVFRLANESTDGTGAERVISLGEISVGVFSQALQNVATLRAQNGASMSQLQHGYDNLTKLKNNLHASKGRIMDVDVASESTDLAKHNVLVQASASMLAQANSLTEISLVLMR
jgi:flagellin